MSEAIELEGIRRHYFAGAGCTLSAIEFGDPKSPPVVLVHGMMDHALSMMPFVSALSGYHVVSVDLRGHGYSDNPGHYALLQFVADLKATFDHFQFAKTDLIGHSLGGHIVARFAALYPELVAKLVLLDGMGPPGVDDVTDDRVIEIQTRRWRETVRGLLEPARPPRIMADRSEAKSRLMAGNPGLSNESATIIADYGVEDVEGGVIWRWDDRVRMIWMTFSHAESEAAWRNIRCPVQVVTGERSLDYWSQRREHLVDARDFYERELRRRCGIFPNAQSVVIPGAGHMLHYDQPELLTRAVRAFLVA